MGPRHVQEGVAHQTPAGVIGFTLVRPGRNILAAAILALLALVAAWSFSRPPPFDHEKARQLTAETRHAYDVVFFNALAMLKTYNRRYGPMSALPDEIRSYHRRLTEEIEHMARSGHFLSHIALHLFDFESSLERQDRAAQAAMAELIEAAEAGEESAMCALLAIPVVEAVASRELRQEVTRRLLPARMASRHGGCLAHVGGAMLLGNVNNIARDRQSAMPRLLEAARQGYFVAAEGLFHWREKESLQDRFDFSNVAELDRALCWGRITAEHSNWGYFDDFLDKLRSYARTHDRPDLVERSKPYDPRLVPPTRTVVRPADCIALEVPA